MQNGIISVLAVIMTPCLKLKPQGSLNLTRQSIKKNQNPQPSETLHKEVQIRRVKIQNFMCLHHVSLGGISVAAKRIKAEINIQS